MGSILVQSDAGSGWVLREIERLCAGEEPDEAMIKQLSSEDRALFEVLIIDALNKAPREDQHRLRSSMIKCGYDEYCARRVMGEDISDRIRASALLALLRPQRRDPSIKNKPGTEGEGTATPRRVRR